MGKVIIGVVLITIMLNMFVFSISLTNKYFIINILILAFCLMAIGLKLLVDGLMEN